MVLDLVVLRLVFWVGFTFGGVLVFGWCYTSFVILLCLGVCFSGFLGIAFWWVGGVCLWCFDVVLVSLMGLGLRILGVGFAVFGLVVWVILVVG